MPGRIGRVIEVWHQTKENQQHHTGQYRALQPEEIIPAGDDPGVAGARGARDGNGSHSLITSWAGRVATRDQMSLCRLLPRAEAPNAKTLRRSQSPGAPSMA